MDDHQILDPAPEEEARSIEVLRGPNIVAPPEAPELPESLRCTVTIVVGDDVSTGDLAPDGVEVMSFGSKVPEIAKFTFRRFDPDYHEKAQRTAPGLIVGGHNYGQGSSREHAALAPLHLGIRVVIAKSFARIHRRNLLSQGIVPLRFANEDDHERFEEGQEWELPAIRRRRGGTRQHRRRRSRAAVRVLASGARDPAHGRRPKVPAPGGVLAGRRESRARRGRGEGRGRPPEP